MGDLTTTWQAATFQEEEAEAQRKGGHSRQGRSWGQKSRARVSSVKGRISEAGWGEEGTDGRLSPPQGGGAHLRGPPPPPPGQT